MRALPQGEGARQVSPNQRRAVAIACNCGKRKNADVKYVFTSPAGQQTSYDSETAAKAAKIRAGGGSIRTASK